MGLGVSPGFLFPDCKFGLVDDLPDDRHRILVPVVLFLSPGGFPCGSVFRGNDGILVEQGPDQHKPVHDRHPLFQLQSTFAKRGPKKGVTIERVIHDGESKKLRVDTDLVGPPSVRFAEDNSGSPVE